MRNEAIQQLLPVQRCAWAGIGIATQFDAIHSDDNKAGYEARLMRFTALIWELRGIPPSRWDRGRLARRKHRWFDKQDAGETPALPGVRSPEGADGVYRRIPGKCSSSPHRCKVRFGASPRNTATNFVASFRATKPVWWRNDYMIPSAVNAVSSLSNNPNLPA